MKREELEKLGLTKEVIDSIMSANGADIENAKKEALTLKKEQEELKKQLLESQTTSQKLQKEFEDFKTSKMTEEEKRQAQLLAEKVAQEEAIKKAEEMEKRYATLIKQTKVKEVLVKGGVVGDDVELFTPGLIADTEELSIERANKFVEFIDAQRTAAAKKAVEEATKNFQDPKGDTDPNKNKKKEPTQIEPVW